MMIKYNKNVTSKLVISNSNETVETTKFQKQPFWKKLTATNEGIITVYFSEKFLIPKNLTELNNKSLEVVLIPSE